VQQFLSSPFGVGEQLLPTTDDVGVALLDGVALGVMTGDELVLQFRDALNAFVLEGVETGVESLLLRQQNLHRRQIATVVIRAHLLLFLG
jgi:hypothetical protein